jgi:hypothetical protein
MIDRRHFFCSIAGLAVNVVVAKRQFGIDRTSKMAIADQEFLIINGWVLTRDDMAASEMTHDVV